MKQLLFRFVAWRNTPVSQRCFSTVHQFHRETGRSRIGDRVAAGQKRRRPRFSHASFLSPLETLLRFLRLKAVAGQTLTILPPLCDVLIVDELAGR
jgi:hypothetical protein